MADIQFSLGGIEFKDWEAKPPIANLGGDQQMALFTFAGGIKTAQLFGPIPNTISWSGRLWGPNAQSRALEIDKLRIDSKAVDLNYGIWSYWGVVKHVEITVENQHEIEFRIDFEPLQDNTTAGSGFGQAKPPTQEEVLDQGMSVLAHQLKNPASGSTFDPGIPDQFATLNNSVSQTISQANNGLISNLSVSQIQSLQKQMDDLLSSLNSIVNTTTDPNMLTSAIDASNTLKIARSTLDQRVPVLKELKVNNPNLFQIAAQYYGDPSAWEKITGTSGLDPAPLGEYTLLLPVEDSTPAEGRPLLL